MNRLSCILLAILTVALLAPVPEASGRSSRGQIISSQGRMGPVLTDGETIVWGQADDWIEPTNRILMTGVATDNPRELMSTNAEILSLDLDDGVVVWIERPLCGNDCEDVPASTAQGIFVDNGEKFTIPTDGGAPTEIHISNGWVALHMLLPDEGDNERSVSELRVMPLDAPEQQRVVAADLPHAPRTFVVGTDFFDGWIVWREHQAGRGGGFWSLWATSIDGTPPRELATGGQYPPVFDMAGNRLVYAHTQRLFAIDLATGQSEQLPVAIFGDRWDPPSTDGRFIFWSRDRWSDQLGEKIFDIVGYDIETRSQFTVAEHFLDGTGWVPTAASFDLSNGVLVWSTGFYKHELNYRWEMQQSSLNTLLPSSPQSQEKTPVGADFFIETGHTLSQGFQAFWHANGGLPVFGFPLTEEFDQAGAGSGPLRRVQIFERQRFEWHPDNAGTPYEVLLGRLGAEAAIEKELFDEPAFLPADQALSADCVFHSETGHNICDDFQRYWEGHGLEFGDDGHSYRESLALFGHPLSEAFVDPETGLQTQYLERAVFELHPNNPPEYRVLLRRPGAELLDRYGWQ